LDLDLEQRDLLERTTIEMLSASRAQVQDSGLILARALTNFESPTCQVALHVMKVMTEGSTSHVRKSALNSVSSFNGFTLPFLVKRFQDRDPDVRRLAFKRFQEN